MFAIVVFHALTPGHDRKKIEYLILISVLKAFFKFFILL